MYFILGMLNTILMNFKRLHLLLLIPVLFVIDLYAQNGGNTEDSYKYIVKKVTIRGKTNINQFSFNYDTNHIAFFNANDDEKYSGYSKQMVKIDLPVKAFDSNNPSMNHDFYALMKSSEFPEITVGIQRGQLKEMFINSSPDLLNFHIQMAGVEKVVTGDYSYTLRSPGKLNLEGVMYLQLDDFSLEPPQKMLGLVQVDNTIFINFDILLYQR